MRHHFQTQPDLQLPPIEKIRLPLKRRDELPPILAGLQWLWMHPTLKAEIFALLEAKILAGNPMPAISVQDAVICKEPAELKSNGSTESWAWKADFTVGKQSISVIWREVEKAAQWRKGVHYDLELELTTKRFQGRTFINWSVVRCAQVA